MKQIFVLILQYTPLFKVLKNGVGLKLHKINGIEIIGCKLAQNIAKILKNKK